MNFFAEFIMLAILLISFTAFIAIFLNASGRFIFSKEKSSFQHPLEDSQKNWRKLTKDSF
ncbi:hypothetical protein [Guptibacillus hwajinpoensis]|uniref:hypothetical protein n=1 Tax=Guptibacillus hwajinpoensis TaxID=208199 RepID=UPI00384B5522